MGGRFEAKHFYQEYSMGTMARHLMVLAGRCEKLTDNLLAKGATKVEVNANESFTLYVELPKDTDKWIPIMVEITNEHPQKVFHLVEGEVTVIKVAMVDGMREV